MAEARRRFRVAFSFTGEKRHFVELITTLLAQRLGDDAILFDRRYEAELNGWRAAEYLSDLYREQSDLIVVVAAPKYLDSDWCRWEWEAILGMLMAGKTRQIMLCRFEGTKLPGCNETTLYTDLDHRAAADAARLILERLASNEGRPRDYYLKSVKPDGATGDPPSVAKKPASDPIPAPPEFYREPPYIGSHAFVGRAAQLEALNDWAAPADSHSIMLFEAIGGTGKSMLAWEWTNRHATEVRGDWAGRFWYSFYEKGAVMADFCQRALAYMTEQPLEEFREKKTTELTELLLHQLRSRPWLLVLDGLERVLVAYHRYDAAQLADAEVDTTQDQMAKRHPRAAIRPEDDELLRKLAAAAPSKILITTRLTPRTLLNASDLAIPGVRRVALSGLRPADAEALFRSCGIRGDSQAIRSYLTEHCDCHPLVTGVLAGLVSKYPRDRGNFDAWAADRRRGGRLNMANLDLVQKQNHILESALADLPDAARQLLSTLALLSEAADRAILEALNPHLPPEIEEVEEPSDPRNYPWWEDIDEESQGRQLAWCEAELEQRREYERACVERERLLPAAEDALDATVEDLESRGLLQYDRQTQRYDLHPVVRGVAAGRLRPEDRDRYGQRVVSHFSALPHRPFAEAQTMEDVHSGLQVVHALLRMERYDQACDALFDGMHNALDTNLEAQAEILAILRPFFPAGWGRLPEGVDKDSALALAVSANDCLASFGAWEECRGILNTVLPSVMKQREWEGVWGTLARVADVSLSTGRLARAHHLRLLGLHLATLLGDSGRVYASSLNRVTVLAWLGEFAEAEDLWRRVDEMGRDWPRGLYYPGEVEEVYMGILAAQNRFDEELCARIERIAREGNNRYLVRSALSRRGRWHLRQQRWALAADNLEEAVRMTREVGLADASAEASLLLARLHREQLPNPRHAAECLPSPRYGNEHRDIAELWLAIGDRERAREHALAAYRFACGDGEPYVYRCELELATALLEKMGEPVPPVPVYDPAKDEKFPWEDELVAAIEELKAEKEREAAEKARAKAEKERKKAKKARREPEEAGG